MSGPRRRSSDAAALAAAAFDSLYQAHYGDVVAMLHALTGDLGEAQDLSQPALQLDHVAMVAALRKLPGDQRRALVLHHMLDLPVAEVAHELGVAVGTVKSWLHRGRAAMAAQLADPAQEVTRQ
jgi:DNA-directed RNA polymerase specialized sigma24 family protein